MRDLGLSPLAKVRDELLKDIHSGNYKDKEGYVAGVLDFYNKLMKAKGVADGNKRTDSQMV